MSLPIEEQWRPVPGWEDRYEVSDQGQVRSLPFVTRKGQYRNGRIRKLHLSSTGYWIVSLYRDDKIYTRYVHRLVAFAFHGEPQPGQQVRHLNGNPVDSRACNLAWGSDQENKADIKRHGRNHNLNKTHCPVGHEYTPENTFVQQTPCGVGRQCRTCHRTRWRSPVRH